MSSPTTAAASTPTIRRRTQTASDQVAQRQQPVSSIPPELPPTPAPMFVPWFVTPSRDGRPSADLEQAEIKWKLVTFGAAGVGKTSLLVRFAKRSFDLTKPTVGIDYLPVTLMLEGRKTVVNAWDTAGSERYQAINSAYIRNADIALLVFDLSSESSLEQVEDARRMVRAERPECVCALIGTKSDLNDGDWVRRADIQKRIRKLKCLGGFYKTSAKSQKQVDDALLSTLGVYYAIIQARLLRASERAIANIRSEVEVDIASRRDTSRGNSCCD